MFCVEVRDHVMIAHSLKRRVFGPAQGLHGATYVVDAAFFAQELDEDGLAVDMGRATQVLKETLAPLNYRNLDDLPEFVGRVTTTEVVSKHIFDRLSEALRDGRFGTAGGRIARLRVTLHESHVARASFEGAP